LKHAAGVLGIAWKSTRPIIGEKGRFTALRSYPSPARIKALLSYFVPKAVNSILMEERKFGDNDGHME
jgi:hypothetical protein